MDDKIVINIVPPADRESPPYTRREWYQIGFKDGFKEGYEKALEDLKNNQN